MRPVSFGRAPHRAKAVEGPPTGAPPTTTLLISLI
jgi:hypothetical protein